MIQALAHPAVQTLLLPLVVSVALLLLLRNHRVAAAAVPVALLVAAVLVVGVLWPPRTGMHKLPWLLATALAVGVTLDLGGASRGRGLLAAGAWLSLSLAWLAWPQRDSASIALAGALLALLAGGLLVTARLLRAQTPAVRPAAMLGVAAAALAVIAFQGGSLSIAQLAGALGVASGGFCLAALRAAKVRFASAGAVAGGGALVLLVAVTGLLTDVSPWALLPLAFVFFADSLAPVRGTLMDLVITVVLAAVPAVLAVVLAVSLTTADPLYYQ